MKQILFVLILFMASGCSVPDMFFGLPNIRVTTDTFDGVIFIADNAAATGLQFEFNDTIIEYWTPTKEQVMGLEAGLLPYLQEIINPEHYAFGILDNLPNIRRQYFGIGFDEGQRLIYAKYFCPSDSFDYWLTGNVAVMDGGECFFQFFYDPETGTFSDLRINGMA